MNILMEERKNNIIYRNFFKCFNVIIKNNINLK